MNPHPPTAYVFGDRMGGRISDAKKRWLAACKAAGITGLHFHDLRHEAGARLADAGWPLHHVQEMLGRSDVKQTSTYLNRTRHSLRESMRKFGVGGQSLHDVAEEAKSEPPPEGNDREPAPADALVN